MGWRREDKYYLNAGKCKSISFTRGSKVSDSELERIDVDNRMTYVNHIELIVSKSARMLGFQGSSNTLTRTKRCM
jgi:hypothetical protein